MSNVEPRLNIEQQKNRAKELRDAIREGQQDAIARVLRHHPKVEGVQASEVPTRFSRLSDAQLVISRELGLHSWPKLRAHIESMDRARRAIASKAPPPDAERATLHVRCGSDIREPLKSAGFVGEFLEVSDPFCLGPLPRNADDLVRVRSRFLGEFFDMSASRIEKDYQRTISRVLPASVRVSAGT